jgi:Zn-dependent peptidase ImmA (M78 family)
LPAPPPPDERGFDFRSLPGERVSLGPEELRNLRDASRIQREISWILQDLDHPEVELFPASIDQDPEDVARAERERLGISVKTQLSWRLDSEALEEWRTALAGTGVFVFALQLGRGNMRGFALKDDYAPVIGINTTGFNMTSRIYTVFHEYAHLLLGRSDVLDDLVALRHWDEESEVERWCERFAASFLLPREELEDFLRREYHWSPGERIDPSKLSRLASRFKVSLRAMALRLSEIGAASQSLFKSLAPVPERRGGGGGGDRRPAIVRRRYGSSVIRLLHEALSEDAVGVHEILDILGITLDDWAQLELEMGVR